MTWLFGVETGGRPRCPGEELWGLHWGGPVAESSRQSVQASKVRQGAGRPAARAAGGSRTFPGEEESTWSGLPWQVWARAGTGASVLGLLVQRLPLSRSGFKDAFVVKADFSFRCTSHCHSPVPSPSPGFSGSQKEEPQALWQRAAERLRQGLGRKTKTGHSRATRGRWAAWEEEGEDFRGEICLMH